MLFACSVVRLMKRLCYTPRMKVFLSYATSPQDAPIAARLRAVAAVYDIQILLPDRTTRRSLTKRNLTHLAQSDAIVALITNNATQVDAVNLELQEAVKLNKPIIALVEAENLIQGLAKNQIVIFDRDNPTSHEHQLMAALKRISSQQKQEEVSSVLGWLAAIALGLVALNVLTTDEK